MSGMFGSYNRNTNNNDDEDLDLFNNQANNRVAVARNQFTNSIVLAILFLFISLLLYKFGKIGELGFLIVYLIVCILSFIDFISLHPLAALGTYYTLGLIILLCPIYLCIRLINVLKVIGIVLSLALILLAYVCLSSSNVENSVTSEESSTIKDDTQSILVLDSDKDISSYNFITFSDLKSNIEKLDSSLVLVCGDSSYNRCATSFQLQGTYSNIHCDLAKSSKTTLNLLSDEDALAVVGKINSEDRCLTDCYIIAKGSDVTSYNKFTTDEHLSSLYTEKETEIVEESEIVEEPVNDNIVEVTYGGVINKDVDWCEFISDALVTNMESNIRLAEGKYKITVVYRGRAHGGNIIKTDLKRVDDELCDWVWTYNSGSHYADYSEEMSFNGNEGLFLTMNETLQIEKLE